MEHQRYKQMLKDLGMGRADVCKAVGIKLNSYSNQMSLKKPGLPIWAKGMLWIYENKGKEIAKNYIDNLDLE